METILLIASFCQQKLKKYVYKQIFERACTIRLDQSQLISEDPTLTELFQPNSIQPDLKQSDSIKPDPPQPNSTLSDIF